MFLVDALGYLSMIAISSGYTDARVDECLDAMATERREWMVCDGNMMLRKISRATGESKASTAC
jgi:hypothetical protein